MPIIKSAKKKMRQDKKKTEHNKNIRENIKKLVKNVRRNPSQEAFQKLTSTLDKASKTKLIHSNKAGRLKSRLSKLLTQKKPVSSEAKPKKRISKNLNIH